MLAVLMVVHTTFLGGEATPTMGVGHSLLTFVTGGHPQDSAKGGFHLANVTRGDHLTLLTGGAQACPTSTTSTVHLATMTRGVFRLTGTSEAHPASTTLGVRPVTILRVASPVTTTGGVRPPITM